MISDQNLGLCTIVGVAKDVFEQQYLLEPFAEQTDLPVFDININKIFLTGNW